MSRFSHPTFAARVADPRRDDGPDEYKRTVCIVCQRWFCDPKVPNPRTGVVDEPKCYKEWLGDRADTPEAQAEYRAAPYKGEGGVTCGWQNSKKDSKGSRCKDAAQSAEAQAKQEKARRENRGHSCYFPGCDGATGRPMGNLSGYHFCGSKQKGCIKRALDYEAVHGKKPEGMPWAEFYRPSP